MKQKTTRSGRRHKSTATLSCSSLPFNLDYAKGYVLILKWVESRGIPLRRVLVASCFSFHGKQIQGVGTIFCELCATDITYEYMRCF